MLRARRERPLLAQFWVEWGSGGVTIQSATQCSMLYYRILGAQYTINCLL